MATRKVLLKEDPTGLTPENFIENEIVDIGTGTYRALVPKYGAFFAEGFVLKDSNDNIINPAQYSFGDLYEVATRNSGKEVWNCILIHNVNVPRSLKISYHAYGGVFSRNSEILLQWVQEKLNEAVSPIDFMDLVDKPREYVPKFHHHLWKEVYGWEYLKKPLTYIENAIELDKSPYFNSIIKDIQDKLAKANERALELARFYANKAVNDATSDINPQTLDIHLLANLAIATEQEMTYIGRSDFDGNAITVDKYINKKGLIAFTESLKERSVNMHTTGLGLTTALIKESKRGSILALSNGSVVTFKSKKEIVDEGNGYEENIYPKNFPDQDRFTVVRITNNTSNHGGVFLGFNNTTAEMFSGVLEDDRCFMRIKWYKFYSDLTYDSILIALNEHIQAKNNPHKLTKKQVNLDKVANLPVVTVEELLGDEPKDAYMTLDAVQLFMTKHLLKLKPEFNEDGSLKKDSDLFNKPNIIYTPCDKKVPNNCPPKGQILKVYCDGTDRFSRVADGNCGFTDEVLQLDSDDCKFFVIKPPGEVLYKYCDQTNQMAVISDGRGGTSTVLVSIDSEECGYQEPPPPGTVISEGCVNKDYVKRFADGNGGVIETIVKINSEDCGFTTTTTTTRPPPTTTITPAPSGPKRIIHQTNTPILEGGTVETLSAVFSGFPPNSSVPFICSARIISWPPGLEQQRPEIEQFKQFQSQIQDIVRIDASGNGTWTYVHSDDGGTVPRDTTWENRVVSDDGTTSNTVVRKFVASGQGGGGTTRPPLTTSPPQPANPSVSFTIPIETINVSRLSATDMGKLSITGGTPGVSYYYQILLSGDRTPIIWQNGEGSEIYNGVIAANSTGSGALNISLIAMANNNPHWNFASDPVRIWARLETGAISTKEYHYIMSDHQNTGGN